ncbi:MAG: hypothetical protein ABJB11_14935 [Ferruginibacter sp.]
MKKIVLLLGYLLFLNCEINSQSLIIKGKIRCKNQHENSTKGAENIVVVPTFMPSKATITTARPSGYFEMNTGVPISKLQDKVVTIYVVSKCANCTELAKRVFISEDQDRQNRNDEKRYVTIKDWMLNTNCQQAELVPFAADSVLNIVVNQPGQNLDNVAAATAVTGAPAFLNFLTNLTSVVGVTGFPVGSFDAESLGSGNIKYGNYLLASPMFHSANTGFNFSPSRDMSEAVFWNPSALVNNKKSGNISLLTNLKNNGKLALSYKLADKIYFGAGAIYTMQDEFRTVTYVNNSNNRLTYDTVTMKLKEYAAFISPVVKINNQLSVGVTVKSLWQNFNIPNSLFVNTVGSKGVGTFTDSSINKQHFDVDVSATYKITSALQVGINAMNLAGTKLYADAFIPGQSTMPVQKQRSLGVGLLYRYQRFNIGADILFTEDGLYDAAFGVNYVPFNNALISAGLAVKQLSYSLAFSIKHFRISYINDNNWMINEKRKGKVDILNGKIYGGFIFDLN